MYVKLPASLMSRHRLAAIGVLAATIGLSGAEADLRLIEAVKSHNTEAIRSLVGRGVDVNARQPDGGTALHWAAHYDDQAAADLLLRAGADVNATNELGATALWLAAAQGSAAMVARLLDGGANPNVALEEGETPLMAAARTGTLEAVKLLAARGGDPNARERLRGQTALMWAAANERPEVVRALIELHADLNARSATRTLVVNTGLQAGSGGYNPPGMADHEEGGFTPLLFAARRGSVESARLLLSAGANVNDAAADGASPLVIAVHSGNGAVARLFLEKGADPDAAGAGYSALHAAVLRSDTETVKALLAHHADPDAVLKKGTPIRRTSVDWALNYTWIGATPYWLAARFADARLMSVLADGGANTRFVMKDGMTPLMAAVGMGIGAGDRRFRGIGVIGSDAGDERAVLEAAKLAVQLGADVNAVNSATGDTALHTVAAKRLNSVIQFLADSGAKLDVKNKKEETPLALVAAPRPAGPGGSSPADDAREKTAGLLRKLGAKE
jgi:ankyrin repeat protein